MSDHRSRRLAALIAAASLFAPALLAPDAAEAAPARAKAGEHGDYSRVVLLTTPTAGWRATPVARGVELRLPNGPDGLDARDVNQRRKAHRVVKMTARREGAETVVRLDFNCDCEANVYPLQGRMLVVDVRDGARAAATRAEPRSAPATETHAKPERAAPAAETHSAPSKQDQVAAAREILLQQLKAAASQGLIEFKSDEKPNSASHGDDHSEGEGDDHGRADTAAHAQSDHAKSDARGDGQASQGDAHAAADHGAAHEGAQDGAQDGASDLTEPTWARPSGGLPTWTRPSWPPQPRPKRAAATDADPGPCLPSSSLDAFVWVEDRPFFEGLAAHRSKLYDDLNKVDVYAVEGLMRFYLGHGLGLEASHVARSFQVDTDQAKLLADLGDVVAGRAPRPGGPFDRADICTGRHALWQAAALAELDLDTALKAYVASTDALSLTPDPLRRILGGRIGAAAARAGHFETARDVLALLARSGGEPSTDMLWIEAALAFDEGRVIAGRRALGEIVERRGPDAPEALTRFGDTLENQVENALAERTADALGDFALQYRGSDIGLRASIAEARLRARFRDLTGAVLALEVARARATPDEENALMATKRGLIADEIAKLVANPTSQAAVEAVQAVDHLKDDAAGDKLRVRLARTLIEMNAEKLVDLVVDDEVATRSPQAKAAREQARAAAKLLPEPVHAVGSIGPGSEPAERDHAGQEHAGQEHAKQDHAQQERAQQDHAAPKGDAHDAPRAATHAKAPKPAEGDHAAKPRDLAAWARQPATAAKPEPAAPKTAKPKPAAHAAAPDHAKAAPRAETAARAEPAQPNAPSETAAPAPRRGPPSLNEAKRLIKDVDQDLKRLKELMSDG